VFGINYVKYQQDMEKGIILEILKQTFKNAIPTHDRRTTLPHLERDKPFACVSFVCRILPTLCLSSNKDGRCLSRLWPGNCSKASLWLNGPSELRPIILLDKDGLLSIPSRCEVVKRTGKLNAERSGLIGAHLKEA
jgi:hypothetical protein